MTSTLEPELIFGPLDHPRYGTILEIHPTVDTTRKGRFASQAVVVTTAARRMIELSKGGQKLAAILVTGKENDPTLHPEFREISENLKELAHKWFPRAKLTLEAGPLHLADAQARHVLTCYEQPILRFGAGTQKTFSGLTGAKGAELKRVVDDLAHIEHENLTFDVVLVRGDVDNTSASELRGIAGTLGATKASKIAVRTLAKATTWNGKKLKAATKTQVEAAVAEFTAKTSCTVEQIDPLEE